MIKTGETGLKLHVEYDSGVITVQLADFDNERTVLFTASLEKADWPNGRTINLSKHIEEIKWKEK